VRDSERERSELIDALETEAHLWLMRIEQSVDPSLRAAWYELLSADERRRQEALLQEPSRLRHLAAWALARTVLSRYAEIEPSGWRFSRGPYGRPEIERTRGGPELRFNLSHTADLAVCLVTSQVDVGVDVETTQRKPQMVRLADRFFDPQEARDVRERSGSARADRFFCYWTLKEAYSKARGRGLSIPLDHAAFRFDQRNTIEVHFAPELEDAEGEWQFEVLRPLRDYLLAAAIRRGAPSRPGQWNQAGQDVAPERGAVAGRDLSLVARWVTPLVEEGGVADLPVVGSNSR
jgi:4'-phosphopantetheinyl transferase